MTVCDKFTPTVLDGRLCYKVDVNTLEEKGSEQSLTIVLDYNDDKMTYDISRNMEDKFSFSELKDSIKDDDEYHLEAMIYIDTLGIVTINIFFKFQT